MSARLRVVFFGELSSTFSRLHYAVLRARADVLLWVAGREMPQGARSRQAFLSWADWWERLWMRVGLEWQATRLLRRPLAGLRVDSPIRFTSRHDFDLISILRALEPDIIVSAGFSRILPSAVLEVPRLGAFNCHPSPLPRYAGSNPWFWILRNGERESAVTIHRMVAEADAGGIVRQKWFAVAPSANYQQVYNESSWRSALLLKECLASWLQGRIEDTPQDLSHRSFFPTPTENDYRIDWNQSAQQIQNLVRASSPAPGAWTTLRGRRLIVRCVAPVRGNRGKPGAIARMDRAGICVTCSDDALWITAISLDAKEARGRKIAQALSLDIGDQFE
jgi:methionyl-tRNA formyltransferase